jgi:putative Ca2+/H+ antiporter (TMEM165/GDT1 family)
MFTAALPSFVLVALAEIGDKSQLVCMTLATRHRPAPVFLGACLAFALLDALAVVFGAGIAALVPERMLALAVAGLFAAFGLGALRRPEAGDEPELEAARGRNAFLATLLLVFVAEFGDKTQLAVAGLAAETTPAAVWLGATAALCAVSGVGVLAGRSLLGRLPLAWLHRAAGVLFLTFAAVALLQAFRG